MFIRKWQLMSDGLGAGHLTVKVGTGDQGICQQKLLEEPGIWPIFLKMPGVCPWVLPRRGMLAAGIDSHIIIIYSRYTKKYIGDYWFRVKQ